MLHRLSKRIAESLLAKRCFALEELDIYIYGTELVISSALGISIILVLSLLFSALAEGVVFLASFLLLRSYTGGYHCYTYVKCNTLFLCLFLSALLLYRVMILHTPAMAAATGVLLPGGGAVLLRYAPVEHPNKPLGKRHRKRCRTVALCLYAGMGAAAVVLECLGETLGFMLALVLGQVSALMLCEKYSQRRKYV